MNITLVTPGCSVKCGNVIASFIKMSGMDALVELRNGSRVMWSNSIEVEVVEDAEVKVNRLEVLKAKLVWLENFAVGKYAQLGLTASTPCAPVALQLHALFITAALGSRPEGAVLCRRCSNRQCVRADHLFWATWSDCQRDMCLRGLARPGRKRVSAVDIAMRTIQLRGKIKSLEST